MDFVVVHKPASGLGKVALVLAQANPPRIAGLAGLKARFRHTPNDTAKIDRKERLAAVKMNPIQDTTRFIHPQSRTLHINS